MAEANDKQNVTENDDFHIEPYQVKEGEEYMGPEMLDHFRNILQSTKHKLMCEVDETVSDLRNEERLADLADRASQEEVRRLVLRTRNREGKLLKKVEETLDRIEADDYGYCEACGIEIGIRRLEARPTATLCIDCKTLDEIREKQQGS